MADWSQVRAGIWLGVAMFLSPSQWCADGALNIGAHDAQDLVTRLRKSIFVDTRYLSERQEKRCTSMDGPRCFAFLAGGGKSAEQGRPGRTLDGPGAVPEILLHDLGVGSDLEFIDDEHIPWDPLHRINAHLEDMINALTGAELRSARESAHRGVLHFAEMPPGSRVPLSFPRGLPGSVVATWDGSWRLRSCGQDEPSLAQALLDEPLFLPTPEMDDAGFFPNAPTMANGLDTHTGSIIVSAGAELNGSVGYLRFSRPVLVRRLYARWRPVEGAPLGLVGGRLGRQVGWTSHLDPKLHAERGWIDIGGGPLDAVDEVAFVATVGLEVGAVEVVAHLGEGDDEVLEAWLLGPGLGIPERPSLQPRPVAKVAAPYIMSLQEMIGRSLKLDLTHPPVPVFETDYMHMPGVSSLNASLMLEEENTTRYRVLEQNRAALFEQQLLLCAVNENRLPQLKQVQTPTLSDLHGLLSGMGDFLQETEVPPDLQTEFSNEVSEIFEAVLACSCCNDEAPMQLPRSGTEEDLLSYITAKRQQTKLDLLTAAYLYRAPEVAEVY